MNGVDRSDQILGKSSALRKCMRWWKTLFFHMIDIAVVNSYILFQLHRAEHPEQEDLKRPKKYSITEFREELVRQLASIEEYGQPPVFNLSAKSPGDYETIHIPQFSEVKKNCKVCYATIKQELKVVTYCSAPQCQVCLHLTKHKNCFATWHSKNWNHKK